MRECTVAETIKFWQRCTKVGGDERDSTLWNGRLEFRTNNSVVNTFAYDSWIIQTVNKASGYYRERIITVIRLDVVLGVLIGDREL